MGMSLFIDAQDFGLVTFRHLLMKSIHKTLSTGLFSSLFAKEAIYKQTTLFRGGLFLVGFGGNGHLGN